MTDRNPRANILPTTELERIPQTGGRGAGSHELETTSDDPAVLRQVIERARERLAFYESFDRIIGENIRRSGELMLETIALREEAQATEEARIAREAAIDRTRQSERDETRTMLTALRDEVNAFQTATVTLASRINDALRTFEQHHSEEADPQQASTPAPIDAAPSPIASSPPEASSSSNNDSTPLSIPTPPASPRTNFRPIRHAMPKAVSESNPALPETPAEDASTHRTIDLVVSGITRATTALAFQRQLGTKAGVAHVETREFAEGVLRLSVEIANDDALSDETFTTWTGPGTIRVAARQPTLIALDMAEA